LCERETAHPQAPPPVPPEPMPVTNRRPRELDTSQYFCPHAGFDTEAGSGLAIYAPTAIPVAAPGARSTARHARATF
jgi:hypothetical protein